MLKDKILWYNHSQETYSHHTDGAICLSVVLTFNSVDKILCGDHLNGTSSKVLSHGTIYLVRSSNFKSVEEILWCYHSNKTSSAVLSHGTIFI